MIGILKKWKEKWGIESNWQFALINIIFAVTGSTTLFIRRPIFHFLGITTDTTFVLKVIAYLLTVTPSFFVMLLAIGTICGQFKFFWNFEKKVVRRFKRKKTQREQK